ncbi:translation elongation factor 2 [Ordospora colligata]|uniref:Translation elongation factor 2 n=1 Tax=Ordospora colligata OC4 TaxID=1354746 RepID=A0A0B2UI38_9MICR|nr:translation elongation factor 2 [Ordospora colligata OC4]KHN68879.1 translation elongation factor 2 [Ordospora colligata OC4]TBU13913.1 translation elongation factor 2 [Ordospora colligata]TBU14102.1 translation elongation factor 2 [Ordospora colligata]TBU17771.1 translation elongation factor 2 [Ordospora colligata]
MDSGSTLTITSIVAHIDHGKTSVIDSLIASQGRISKTLAGSIRFLDTREDEQVRGITLKLSAISLQHAGQQHIFIDTPGHVDFEALIQVSSILSNSFLILIDINEGITPRTLSLVKYTKGKRCVLMINKIDKISTSEEMYGKAMAVVSAINGLVGKDVFEWTRNNIILCCATMCYGISNSGFESVVQTKGTIKDAIKFIFHLHKRIDNGDIGRLQERFNICGRSKKNILSTVLPLSDAIFNSVKCDRIDEWKLFLQSDAVNLRAMPQCEARSPSVMGVTVYSVLKNAGMYSRDSLLFVTRIFHGTIKTDQTLFSINHESTVEFVVEGLYCFGINELIEVEQASGPALVCIKGNLMKNSLVMDVPTHSMDFESKVTPFYKFKVVLEDPQLLDELKSVLRVMSCTEQFLKAKVNKYGEVEVSCTGKVQSEKIITDLTYLGFKFSVMGLDDRFCEYAIDYSSDVFEMGNLILKVEVCKSIGDDECFIQHKGWRDSDGNEFVVVSDVFIQTISSVLETFASCGPLIMERICQTRFVVDLQGYAEDIQTDIVYSFVRQSISSVYLSCKPMISPSFYECTISMQEEFVGETYKSLSRHYCIVQREEYEESTGFCVIVAFVPQLQYSMFLEDIKIKTKGTGYLLLKEKGYMCVQDAMFNKHIDEIRKKKGMMTEEKIVQEASKQRTHKK